MFNEQKFAEQIREQGYRMTSQRRIVLEAIQACDGHASANQLYDWVQEQAPSVNRATVYRTLNFLCELQLVARFELGSTTLYELIGEHPHHHLVCRQCEHVSRIPEQTVDVLAETLQREHGFQAELQHLAITGLCCHCVQPTDDHSLD